MAVAAGERPSYVALPHAMSPERRPTQVAGFGIERKFAEVFFPLRDFDSRYSNIALEIAGQTRDYPVSAVPPFVQVRHK
jgi:hypothetical protein